mgnify:CR=1 FL=1
MDTNNITDKTYNGLIAIWHKVVTFMPDLIVALLFLLAGWVISSLIKRLLNKSLLKIGFNTFLDKLGLDTLLKKMDLKVQGSQIVASIISVFIFLIFLLAALDIVGLDMLSGLIDTVVLFLPKLLSITQLDIDVWLLNSIISVIIASVGLAAAISLGIGTKSMAQEIVAGVYLREMYQTGDNIEVQEVKGALVSIGSVASKVIGEKEAIITIPNTFLLSNKVTKQ